MHDPVFLDMLLGDTQVAKQVHNAKCHLLQYRNDCAFIDQCIQRYTKMKEEIREPGSEKNFITVQEYWTSIQEILIAYEFAGNAEEIHFFKWIKPLFTGEKEYYSLLHHAELFSTADPAFWQRQPARLEKLTAENKNVIDAYINANTRYDEWWYCRGEWKDRTVHDDTIGSYLGMIRYLKYVQTQLPQVT
ncbi:MAG TPA: RteC domain-containing protein [Chitinophagaceae bacterium]|jgi:hypothetical protein|nr:RteC domain-containing protein [Chitinophagaceae bacterium]